MELKPLFDRVVIKPYKKDNSKKQTILLPDSAQEKPLVAVVLACGDGNEVDGKKQTMFVKPNDRILYSKYAGNEFKLDGDEIVIIRQTDILAIIENKENN